MSLDDMTTVIEDAVQDATEPEVAIDATSDGDTTAVEAVAEVPVTEGVSDSSTPEATTIQDEFEKRWGIPSRSVTGRENRIPHTRVKQMVTKAEAEALTKATKDAEAKFTPRITEFETKVRDYEERLTKVAQFEHILENDPRSFLNLLSQIPAYKSFFDYIGKLSAPATETKPEQIISTDGMPQPDGPDGLYTRDGLLQRDEWLARQIEARAVQQAEAKLSQRYAPIEQEWQRQQRQAQMAPVIEQQIAEARTWPNFVELEPEIVKALNADPRLSLDRAYNKVYQAQQIPKIAADRNRIRSEVLAEIQKKPLSSSAPGSSVRPSQTPAANRTMEQVIEDELKAKGLM